MWFRVPWTEGKWKLEISATPYAPGRGFWPEESLEDVSKLIYRWWAMPFVQLRRIQTQKEIKRAKTLMGHSVTRHVCPPGSGVGGELDFVRDRMTANEIERINAAAATRGALLENLENIYWPVSEAQERRTAQKIRASQSRTVDETLRARKEQQRLIAEANALQERILSRTGNAAERARQAHADAMRRMKEIIDDNLE